MRALILGAAGKTGRAVLAALSRLPGIEVVYLADADAESLCRMVNYPAPFSVHLRYLEAGEERSLRERISEADLVVGCLGPFHLHELQVIRVVVETGRDYLSLCDDAATTREALFLQEEAQRTGSRVLLGCGMTPGLSNLLALRAASRLEEVRNLTFYWRPGPVSSLGEGAIRHLIRSFSGKAVLLKGGREEAVRAGSWPEPVEFPPPSGRMFSHYFNHPECLTVPRFLPQVQDVCFRAGSGSLGVDILLQCLSRVGDEGYLDVFLGALQLARGRKRSQDDHCPSLIRVTAEGVRQGRRMKISVAAAGDYYRASACLTASAVEWVRSEPPAGLYAPEEALNHPWTFERLRTSGLRFYLAEEGNGSI